MRPTRSAFMMSLALLVCACGGGGGGGGDRSVRLSIAFDRSGGLASDGGFYPAANFTLGTGDSITNLEFRAFLSFVLSPLPPGGSIQSATLHMRANVAQGDPSGLFGAAVIDHVTIGAGIEAGDFAGGTLTPNYAVLPVLTAQLMDITLDVTAAVQADLLAARPSSTFRLYFPAAPSLNSARDDTYIECSTIGDQPFITVVLAN